MKSSDEQLKAIQASSSATLKAGAGAGKTYVIIEHFIYCLNVEREKSLLSDDSIRDILRGYVIITFTKKAAQELRDRIELKVKSLTEKDFFWGRVFHNLNFCFIGTIHSYCYSLLKESKVISNESYALSDSSLTDLKVASLVDAYVESEDVSKDILLKLNEIKHSIKVILADPLLRISWEEAREMNLNIESLKCEFLDVLEPSICSFSFDAKSKSEVFLSDFLIIKQECRKKNRYEKFEELFEQYPRNPPVSKLLKEIGADVSYEKLKVFKKIFSEFNLEVKSFENNYESIIAPRFLSIKKIVDFVSKHYFEDKKISFSDLEYLILKNKGNINAHPKKLIIDEFQDVSWSQFEVFNVILGGAFKNLYAIGDLKQAIYSFRGGEVSVFNKVAHLTEKTLSLKSNYRSGRKIVHFNNAFFKNIIAPFEEQVPQLSLEGEVKAYTLKTEINYEFDRYFELESSFIFEEIKKDINNNSLEDIAIIYKYLSASTDLVQKLISSDISYNASYKVEYSEEPITSIFHKMLDLEVGKIDFESCLFFLEGYFYYLGIKVENLPFLLKDFQASIGFLGLFESFLRFLGSSQVSHAYASTTLKRIQEICLFYNEDILEIREELKNISGERVSLLLSQNSKSINVELMSAHASKGLEFDKVYVAGIMKNDKGKSDRIAIGKNVGSFSYYDEGVKHITPHYFLERAEKKIEEEAESVRLLYVACTRAIKQLVFVFIENFEDKISNKSKSWGRYLKEGISELNQINIEKRDFDLKESFKATKERASFHFVDFSIYQTPRRYTVSVLPELSVTKLSKASLCPRKFYFSEVLKIDVEDLPDDLKIDKKQYEERKVVSSAERGTKVHREIEVFLKEGIESQELGYVKKILKDYEAENWGRIVEQEIKFELEGVMISGAPDLILYSKNFDNVEIWDFKTGELRDQNTRVYRSQLALYLYAYIENGNILPMKISGKNIYIDEERCMVFEWSSFEELKKEVLLLIRNCFNYHKENKNLCESCEYFLICQA